MLPLLTHLGSAAAMPLDLILHIGPGPFATPSDYATLQPARIVFVEADPASASRLQSTCAHALPHTLVVEKLLLPQTGPASLFKFNLPALNGIRPAGALATLYPNLRLLEELPLNGESLSTFLDSLALEAPGHRLLFLDVPGQEADLLESLPPDQLEHFEWILLRGCHSPLQDGACLLPMATSLLETRHFEPVAADLESDPAWPLQLLRFNRPKADLHKELNTRAQRIADQAAEIHQQAERLAQLEPQLAHLQAQSDSFHHELLAAREQTASSDHNLAIASQQLEHARAQLLTLETQNSDLTSNQAALEAELETRARLLIEKATQIHQQAERLAQLEPQLAHLQAQSDSLHHELLAAREQTASSDHNLAIASQQLEHAQAHLLTLETQNSDLTSNQAALEAELETRARLLIEKATEIHQQYERLAQLEPQLAHLQAHSDALHHELVAARAQTASSDHNLAIASQQLEHAQAHLLTLEAQKAELESQLGSQKTLVQALSKGRTQQDLLAQDLTREQDSLRQSLASAQTRIADLEAQLLAKEARTALIDAEFQKIEGQMDLIKGMVFREHGR